MKYHDLRVAIEVIALLVLSACAAPPPAPISTVTAQPTHVTSPISTPTAMVTLIAEPTPTPISIRDLLVISPLNATSVTQVARLGKGEFNKVAWSPDGMTLAVATSIGIFLYNPETLEELRFIDTRTSILSIAFSPDGQALASGSYQKMQLWNTNTGELLGTLKTSSHQALSVAFSPNGHMIASGWSDYAVRLWEYQQPYTSAHTRRAHQFGAERRV